MRPFDKFRAGFGLTYAAPNECAWELQASLRGADRFTAFPALNAPGYCRLPLRGKNLSVSFHCIVRNVVLTQILKRCATQKPDALPKNWSLPWSTPPCGIPCKIELPHGEEAFTLRRFGQCANGRCFR